ncbi:unnamed protein product [Polarella glacialis]|uniref:Uncharacterized protein n=1 Tax=Polarella glacialis TaxID=89957 RepID=A0A813JVW2_POLGL|nr:unnamed protein product [Polarella glacialis]
MISMQFDNTFRFTLLLDLGCVVKDVAVTGSMWRKQFSNRNRKFCVKGLLCTVYGSFHSLGSLTTWLIELLLLLVCSCQVVFVESEMSQVNGTYRIDTSQCLIHMSQHFLQTPPRRAMLADRVAPLSLVRLVP